MKYPSFVEETTATTGTGNITLAGATTGNRTLSSAVATGDYVPYHLINATNWERGIGKWNGTTFERTAVLENSAGTQVAVSLTGTSTFRVGATPPVGVERRGCRLTRTTAVNIAVDGFGVINWENEIQDTDACHTGTNAQVDIPDWCDLFQFTFRIYGVPDSGTPTGGATMGATIHSEQWEDGTLVLQQPAEFEYTGSIYQMDTTMTTPILQRGSARSHLNEFWVRNNTGQQLNVTYAACYLVALA